MGKRSTLCRLAIACCAVSLALAVPRPSSAALRLGLPHSDYPKGTQIAVYPATNGEADFLLHVHHRSFTRLGRIDGEGWLQAALWHFYTGTHGTRVRHDVTFGYGINIFHNTAQAVAATHDVKLKVRPYRVAHIPALRYTSVDAHWTVDFVFFAFHRVEVEAYYEYAGVAPTKLSGSLHHIFSRQTSHLAHEARRLHTALRTAPTATAIPTDTPTPLPTSTPTVLPTAPPTSTPHVPPTPAPTATRTPVPPTAMPAPSPTPAGLIVTGSMTSSSYKPGEIATVMVQVTDNGQPVSGARVNVSFLFPGHTTECTATADANGNASCGVPVPSLQNSTLVNVWVHATAPSGESTPTLYLQFTISNFGA